MGLLASLVNNSKLAIMDADGSCTSFHVDELVYLATNNMLSPTNHALALHFISKTKNGKKISKRKTVIMDATVGQMFAAQIYPHPNPKKLRMIARRSAKAVVVDLGDGDMVDAGDIEASRKHEALRRKLEHVPPPRREVR